MRLEMSGHSRDRLLTPPDQTQPTSMSHVETHTLGRDITTRYTHTRP